MGHGGRLTLSDAASEPRAKLVQAVAYLSSLLLPGRSQSAIAMRP